MKLKIARRISFFFFLATQLIGSFSFASVLITANAEGRLQQDMSQDVVLQNYFSLASEYHWQNYFAGVEYFQGASVTSGNPSLMLSSSRQGGWVTGAWQAGVWKFIFPYVRVGFGGYEDSVTTTLLNLSSTSVSRVYMCGFGGLGLRWNSDSPFFLATEARLIFGENQNPQPAGAISVRVGWDIGAHEFKSEPTKNRGSVENQVD